MPSFWDKLYASHYRCEDGKLMRHDPQWDDPYLETEVGTCPKCDGKGCQVAEDDADLEYEEAEFTAEDA